MIPRRSVRRVQDPRYASKPFPVVAIYPREGTFWSDHPYAILELPTVTGEVREAAEAFRSFLLSHERQQVAFSRFGFRPADPAIPVGPPIDAAYGLDAAQPKNVLPNPPVAVTRRALDGFDGVKRPVSITFVIDTWGSMEGDPLLQGKAGARLFLESLPDTGVARVMTFSSAAHWVSDRAEPLARARPRLIAAIESTFGHRRHRALRFADRKLPAGTRGCPRHRAGRRGAHRRRGHRQPRQASSVAGDAPAPGRPG